MAEGCKYSIRNRQRQTTQTTFTKKLLHFIITLTTPLHDGNLACQYLNSPKLQQLNEFTLISGR